jgi:hypothetical protein
VYPSGDLISAPKPSPEPSPPCSQGKQEYWIPDQMLTLLRGVTCHVSRPDVFFHRPSLIACCEKSGS